MKIEQVDREAAGAYLRSDDCPATVKMTIKPQALIEAFARHRIQALEQAMNDAVTALKSVQYSPAPYTDGVKAIRARFLQPADEVKEG